MISKVCVVVCAVVSVALARPDSPPSLGYAAPGPVQPVPLSAGGPSYSFNYAVKDDYSGNDFGHEESRDGYDTQGSYYVQLPDTRLQKVTYYVNGDSGYVAQVGYQGEAQYPAYQPAPASAYKPAPAPAYKAPEVGYA